MSSKKELIQELLDMQRKFIEFEHKNGVHPDDYYNPGAGHELDGYKDKYMETALKVLNMAHDEHGSGWKQ